jgi:AhpD family alkylhydroperoxidase
MKLDNRIQELIAVGASIAANCQPCLKHHFKKASESGTNEQEIAEAVEIGRMVRKGALSSMDKFVAGLNQAVASGITEAVEGCGCGS